MKRLFALLGLLLLSAPAWAVADELGAALNPGTAGTLSALGGCIYRSGTITATTGQQMGLSCDLNGNLLSSGPTGASSMQVQGNSASGVADVGNPVKIGGLVNATTPAGTTTGNRIDGWFGSLGQLMVGTVRASSGADGTSNTVGLALDQSNQTRLLSTVTSVFNGTTWDRLRDATSANATTGTGLQGAGILGKFNTSAPTYTDGQYGNVQLSTQGNVLIGLPLTTLGSDAGQAAVISLSNRSGQTANLSVSGMLLNGSATADRARGVQGVDGTGLGVAAVASVPQSTASGSLTPTVSAAVTGGVVYKASAGNLYSVTVTAGASAGYLLMFNSTTVPADGAVTPQQCIPVAANAGLTWDAVSGGVPERYTVGIVGVFSTTGCFTKTISATAFLRAKFQ